MANNVCWKIYNSPVRKCIKYHDSREPRFRDSQNKSNTIDSNLVERYRFELAVSSDGEVRFGTFV